MNWQYSTHQTFQNPLQPRSSLMRRLAITLLAGFVLVSISTHDTIHAQETSPSFKIGGGLGFPIDAEGIKNGPAILTGASLPVYGNLHAVLEGHYSKYGAEDELLSSGISSADVKLLGGNIGIMLRSPSSPVSIYGHGGVGITRGEGSASVSFLGESLSVSDTETVFSFTIGGGVLIPVNPSIGVAIDARYSHVATEGEATKWMPITVSLVFTP